MYKNMKKMIHPAAESRIFKSIDQKVEYFT